MNEWWLVTTPFVDAYERHDGVPTDEEFAKAMNAQAWDWGRASVGERVIEGKEPAKLPDGRLVLAIGHKGGQDKWVAVPNGKPYETEIVKFDWPFEWDVT